VRRILRAEWYNNDSAEGNGSDAPLNLFERPVRLGGQQKKQGAVVDRSVVTAGGVAVSAVDKLGPETSECVSLLICFVSFFLSSRLPILIGVHCSPAL
jgi:hypothetical protein